MTDRELLELAAKAAGYWDERFDCYKGAANWNPLDDDGDALRLAVKLKLLIDTDYCCAQANGIWFGRGDENAGVSHDECDPYAATRRAIVKAAAEIGRSME